MGHTLFVNKKTVICLGVLIAVLAMLLLFSGESFTTDFKYSFY